MSKYFSIGVLAFFAFIIVFSAAYKTVSANTAVLPTFYNTCTGNGTLVSCNTQSQNAPAPNPSLINGSPATAGGTVSCSGSENPAEVFSPSAYSCNGFGNVNHVNCPGQEDTCLVGPVYAVPDISIDSPFSRHNQAPVSGIVSISGWAADVNTIPPSSGSAISGLTLSIDSGPAQDIMPSTVFNVKTSAVFLRRLIIRCLRLRGVRMWVLAILSIPFH